MSVSRVTIQFPLWKKILNMPFSVFSTSSVLHGLSKMISSGSVMTSANSLSTLGCQPLGPVDLNISGLLRFCFTHPSPSPSWMPVPVLKSGLYLSGYHVDFWKTAFNASASHTFIFSFKIINGKCIIFFWSLWFIFKCSNFFFLTCPL